MNKLTISTIAVILIFVIQSFAGGPGSGRKKGSGSKSYTPSTKSYPSNYLTTPSIKNEGNVNNSNTLTNNVNNSPVTEQKKVETPIETPCMKCKQAARELYFQCVSDSKGDSKKKAACLELLQSENKKCGCK